MKPENENSMGLNPFLPLDTYIPDGEPKQFGDRVYLYGSKDLFNEGYCCDKFHVYSAPVDHLTEWTDHGTVLASTDEYASEGIKDGIPWSDVLLWAPDIIKKGDVYYLYFCLSDGSEGVASSTKPYGPFENAKRIVMNGKPIEGIDPSVLEDHGVFYYTWGQANMHMAELEDDMCTLKSETYHEVVISHQPGQQGFHEASSFRKIGEHYCIVYASEWTKSYPNCGGTPTKLDYAISDHPYGPYQRMGTIIDNTGVDPQSWNNHGSIIKLGDQWYVFYHGSSNNSKFSRRARVEKLTVNEAAGTIEQAHMSSGGFLGTITPEMITEPAHATRFVRGTYVTEKEDETHPMVHIHSGSLAMFRYLDFGDGSTKYNLSVKYHGFVDSKLKVYIKPQAKPVGVIELKQGEGVLEANGNLDQISGVNEVCFEFCGKGNTELCELIKIKFSRI